MMLTCIKYLRARLNERSTWASIGVAIVGAGALSAPWSYVFVAVGVIGTLVPTTDDVTKE